MARIRLATIASDDTPPASQVSIYVKTNKRLYFKDDTGFESEVSTRSDYAGSTHLVEYFDLTAEHISAKELTLSEEPSFPERTLVDVANGGGMLRYGHDFTVSGNVLTWSGGRFDGIFEEGEELRVVYY
jgi:hypothetical protein